MRNSTSTPSRKRVGVFAFIVIAIFVAVIGLLWFLFGIWADAAHVIWSGFLNNVWRPWLFPNGWNLFGATPFFWMIILALGLGVAYFIVTKNLDLFAPFWFKVTSAVVTIAWAVLAIVSMLAWSFWDASYYNTATTYKVTDAKELPNTLVRVSTSAGAQVDIAEGVMPSAWDRRVASATGATYVMKKTGDSNSNTELMDETVAYIYGDAGKGSWTAIRNGKNRQSIYGVASWAGTGEAVKNCQFKGDYELNKAFGGTWGMNLTDDIAEFDPNFVYSDEDMYGYCDGDKPVIVIPGARTTGLQMQTALESYGVMIIQGSPSGTPRIEFRDTVKPGDLPGPAYPVSLTERQRDALSYSAGWVWPWQTAVGFEPTDSPSQEGNSTDFLLRDTKTGRLYWVTPMIPIGTDSQTIVAYAMVAADELNGGRLNDQVVYVLNDNDPNIVNFNDLTNAVTQAVGLKDSAFFTGEEANRGRIVEFIPTGVDSWMVFAERGGRAVYQINVTGGAQLNTNVVTLGGNGLTPAPTQPSTGSGQPTATGCDNLTGLSDLQIAECISKLSGELTRRHQPSVTK